MYLDAIFSGLIAGLVLALMALGPSFFTLIKVGIHQNFQCGAYFAFGIILSDFIIVLLVYMGLSQFYEAIWFKQLFSLIGGVLVLVFGIQSFKPQPPAAAHELGQIQAPSQYIIEGFGLNILNPFTFGLWLFVIALVNDLRNYSQSENLVFYASVFITIFSTDLLKAYLANYTGKNVSNGFLNRVNKVIGIILILISCRMLYFFYTLTYTS